MLPDNKIKELINKYDTPLYLFDYGSIESQIDSLKSALPPKAEVFFSMKVNPNIGILSAIKNLVSGIEVSSEGELYSALFAGYSPKRIIFVGPGKTEKELEYAVEVGLLAIVVESQSEIKTIQKISNRKNTKTDIMLRINPSSPLTGAKYRMTGVSSQFGIEEDEVFDVISTVKCLQNVNIKGIQVFVGAQILAEETLADIYDHICGLTIKIMNQCGIDFEIVDFGGGFGIPYSSKDTEFNTDILHNKYVRILSKYHEMFDKKIKRSIFESGRYLLGKSGIFLTRVLSKKMSKGNTFVITDGGSNFHAMAANIGGLIRNNFPIKVLGKSDYAEKNTVTIVGPLCTPKDILALDLELPLINIGDIIAVLNSGAYGLTASMCNFLSHPLPAEILLVGDKVKLIRDRGSREDFIKDQHLFERSL
jgi:diaminopimelate decarboxylase